VPWNEDHPTVRAGLHTSLELNLLCYSMRRLIAKLQVLSGNIWNKSNQIENEIKFRFEDWKQKLWLIWMSFYTWLGLAWFTLL
jgi:hypothetical protein